MREDRGYGCWGESENGNPEVCVVVAVEWSWERGLERRIERKCGVVALQIRVVLVLVRIVGSDRGHNT